MNLSVEQAVNALREAFPQAKLAVEDDGAGGAYVQIEPVELGPRFTPPRTWVGGHLPPQLPYADVYPVFIAIVRLARSQVEAQAVVADHDVTVIR